MTDEEFESLMKRLKSAFNGLNPLRQDLDERYAEVKSLIDSEPDTLFEEFDNGETVLSTAIDLTPSSRSQDFLEWLLEKELDVDIRYNKGRTALMSAAAGDDDKSDWMEMLIMKGADVNAKDSKGKNTPLHYATSAGT
jgi:ankyrin repeat protein